MTCDVGRVCRRFVCCWLSPTLGKLFVSRSWLPTSSVWSRRNPHTPHKESASCLRDVAAREELSLSAGEAQTFIWCCLF